MYLELRKNLHRQIGVGDVEHKLKQIRKAYDLTAEQYRKGIKPYDTVPEGIKNLPGYKHMITGGSKTSSNSPDIREYLNPKSGYCQ